MKKFRDNLLILIILAINFIGIIIIYNTEITSTSASINTPVKDRLELIKEKGVLTVASSGETIFSYIDPKTNKFSGVDAEIITDVAKRLGINKVEMIKVPFKDLLTELNSNDSIDIVADGMSITDDRKKNALFTNVWYKEGDNILVLKFSPIISKETLKNETIGAVTGSTSEELALKWKNDGLIKDIVTFDDIPKLLSAVNTGKIDAAILGSIVASYELSKDPTLYLKVLYPYTPEYTGMIAAAARKSDTTLVDAVNEKIDEMKKDNTLSKILKKYNIYENSLKQ